MTARKVGTPSVVKAEGAASVVVPVPSDLGSGPDAANALLAVVISGRAQNGIDALDNFTDSGLGLVASADNNEPCFRVGIRLISSEPADYTFFTNNHTDLSTWVAALVPLADVDEADFFAGTPQKNQDDAGSVDPLCPSMTTDADDALVLLVAGTDRTPGTVVAAEDTGYPAGSTGIFHRVDANGNSSFYVAGGLATKVQASAGATGTNAWDTVTVAPWVAGTIAIKTAAPAGAVVSSVDTDDVVDDLQQNVVITLTGGGTQGAGSKAEVGDNAVYGSANLAELPVDSWEDTDILADFQQLSGAPLANAVGTGTRWVFITPDGGSPSSGHQITLNQTALAPNAVVSGGANLQDTSLNSPPTDLTDIQDDPGNPDADWYTALVVSAGIDVILGFPPPDFPTPTTPLADQQTFHLWLRKTAGAPNPLVTVYLYEDGVQVGSALVNGQAITSESGELVVATWDAGDLATADGSLVQVRIVGEAAMG